MGEPSARNMEALRTRARERMRQGKLPHHKAARTWGGLGSGLPCALCDAAILSNEPEFELQLDLSDPSQSVRFHRLCHSIWNEVREEYSPAHDWRPVVEQLPPLGAHVEARVSLGGTRSVILNAVCLKEPSAPGCTWINITTGGPLPEGWRPIEWRYLAGVKAESAEQKGEPAQPFNDSSLPRRA